jgi:pimeloyl-ACP methyl ester carboxylesterase
MRITPFELRFGDVQLRGDAYAERCPTLVLHGAGKSSRARFSQMRAGLDACGLPSVSFDFIGHGETGGKITDSSLHGRTAQAATVIRHACAEPLTLIAASMGAYVAIKLTAQFAVNNLILMVPAVYTPEAYDLGFGPRFSAAIRVPGSWRDSDAFGILEGFTGNLLVIAAAHDHVIPRDVIERIHRSGKHARTNLLHIVPESEHLSLFPRTADRQEAIDLIVQMCRSGQDDKPKSGGAASRPPRRNQRYRK